MTTNISEFERNKPRKTHEQINKLIKMSKDFDKKIGGKAGVWVKSPREWAEFSEELKTLKELFLKGE